ncbi:hypothetical protein ACQ4PT_064219 [Festuca glaucescens]
MVPVPGRHIYLDRFSCNIAWDGLFSPCSVLALSSSHSDHCPLLLSPISPTLCKARFRFENFWPSHQGFSETVAAAWMGVVRAKNPITRLRVKLARTARALRSRNKERFGNARFQLLLANEIILRLDITQDSRPLSSLEHHFRKALKVRVLGLAAVERARRRQASRVTWLREGDANTRFFHAKMNARRRKNHIQVLHSDSGIHSSHEEKEEALRCHLTSILGSSAHRGHTLNWDNLELPIIPAAGLDNPFTSKEVWEAIKDSPTEKALGPDGFTGMFFRRYWGTIKHDIMAAFHHVFHLAGGDFAALNKAFICLVPKKDCASRVGDCRPISLIHSFAKLFSKVLARRLTPIIGTMISQAQTAFLKKRCLHESFLYVRNLARALHRKNKPALLFKLDFARAFDFVSWTYLLELFQRMGFSARWRD